MVRTERRPAVRSPAAAAGSERRRGVALGALTGTIGLGCCVGPTILALLGLSSATAAASLGNHLYADWGWAFKGSAALFAATALAVQKRRAATCAIDERPDLGRMARWLAGSALISYGALYAGTKALEQLAT